MFSEESRAAGETQWVWAQAVAGGMEPVYRNMAPLLAVRGDRIRGFRACVMNEGGAPLRSF